LNQAQLLKNQSNSFLSLTSAFQRNSTAIFIAALAFLLYTNTLGHDYVLDDQAVITQNEFTQKGAAGIGDILTNYYWRGYWDTNAGLYRPLSEVTFALEWELFENNPHLGHFNNALLYGLLGFLIFFFLSDLLIGCSPIVPFLAALVFICHPIHTEVVANIKSRDELLCLVFFVLSAMPLVRSFDQKKPWLLWVASGCFLLSLLSKESGVTFILIFPLLLYFFRNQSVVSALKSTWVLALPLVLYLIVHTLVVQDGETALLIYSYQDNSLLSTPNVWSRLATSFAMILDYFRLLVFPYPLSYDYSFNQIPVIQFTDPKALLELVLCLALAFIAIRGFKGRDSLSFSILFFAITFSMTSNLVFPIGTSMAERFLFTPSLGFSLALAFLTERHLLKTSLKSSSLLEIGRKSPWLSSGVIAIVLVLSGLTISRNRLWESNLTLFGSGVIHAPNSSRAHSNYGTAYLNAVALAEPSPKKKALLMELPMEEFKLALQIDAKNTNALQNMGLCLYYRGDYAQSADYSKRCIQLDQKNGQAFAFLGKALFRLNQFEEAIEALQTAKKLAYEDHSLKQFLAASYFQLNDYAQSTTYYELAYERDSQNIEIINGLASCYGNIGNTTKAIELFEKSHSLDPNNASTCQYLGIGYQLLGDSTTANRWFQKAESLRQ
jgi:protein O-mannosyl-transferase